MTDRLWHLGKNCVRNRTGRIKATLSHTSLIERHVPMVKWHTLPDLVTRCPKLYTHLKETTIPIATYDQTSLSDFFCIKTHACLLCFLLCQAIMKKNPKNSQSISLYNQRHWKQNFFFLNQTKLKRLYLAFEAILKLFHAEGYSSAPQTPLTAKAKYLGTYGPAED